MNLKIFTVYDSKVEAYMSPFFAQSTGAALRMWTETVNDTQTQFNRHPADFTLFEIGSFDPQTGSVTPLKAHVNLGLALDFKEKPIDMPNLFTPKQLTENQGAHQ